MTRKPRQGRPLAFDPDQALEKAMLLFWAQGYEGTSTADLMEAMGLSKSSLYQTFESKQVLFQRCLETYGRMTYEQMQNAFGLSSSPKQFLLDLFRATATYAPGPGVPLGCLLVNTACELGVHSDVAGEVLRGRTDRVLALFRQAAQAMQKKGEIAASADPNRLAHQLMTCLCGLKVAEKLNYSEQERLATLDMVEKLLS